MYVQAWLSSLKLFWITCSLFTIVLWSSKLTNMFFDLASFSLPGNDLWHCPSGVIWFSPVRQYHNPALLNPHFHRIVQLFKKATCGSGHLVGIFAWPFHAISTALVMNYSSNGEINRRQRKAATISKSLASSAFLSRVALKIKCQLLHVAVTWGAPDPAAREFLSSGGCPSPWWCRQDPVCLHTVQAAGSLAQVISCTV